MPARKRGTPKPIKSDLKPHLTKAVSKIPVQESQFDKSVQTLDLGEKVNHNQEMGKSKGIFILVLVVLVVIASGAAVYSYNLYQKSQEQIKGLKANPQEIAKIETKKTVEAVGQLIALPKNESPTIATVTDAKKLKNQPFFAKAETGDKVLIYTQAKKAILYRASINKIIEVAPVNLGQQSNSSVTPGSKGTPVPTTKAKVTTAPKVSPTESP